MLCYTWIQISFYRYVENVSLESYISKGVLGRVLSVKKTGSDQKTVK